MSSTATSTPTSATTPKTPRKKRNLLRAYYGVVDGNTTSNSNKKQQQGDPLENRRADPLDLDHPTFNSELYLQKYLYEVNLSDLIQRDNDLTAECKLLDGDMKTLVYENYSKFISATDTLKNMQQNILNMEQQVELLTDRLDRVESNFTSINTSFSERRARIHQLSGVHQLLRKLNFVFELPDRLKQCYKRKEYEQSVRYYTKATTLLSHYGHLSMFKKIADESHAIMNDVSKKILDKIRNDSTSIAEIGKCIDLLVGLDNQTPNNLAKLYIQSVEPKFKQLVERVKLQSKASMSKISLLGYSEGSTSPTRSKSPSPINPSPLLNTSEAMPKTPSTQSDEKLLRNLISVNNTLLRVLIEFVHSFDTLFISSSSSSSSSNSENRQDVLSQSSLSPISNNPQDETTKVFKSNFSPPKMNDKEYKLATQDLQQFSMKILVDYISLTNEITKLPNEIFSINTNAFKSTLKRLLNDGRVGGAIQTHLQLEQKCISNVEEWMVGFVKNVFDKVINEFLCSLTINNNNRNDDDDDDFGNEYGDDNCIDEFCSSIDNGLRKCQELFLDFVGSHSNINSNSGSGVDDEEDNDGHFPMKETLVYQIRLQFSEFWRNLFKSSLEMVVNSQRRDFNKENNKDWSKILVLSKLALKVVSTPNGNISVIESLYILYGESMFGLEQQSIQKLDYSSRRKSKYNIEHEVLVESREVCNQVKNIAQDLLKTYVAHVSDSFSIKVCDYINEDVTFWYEQEPSTEIIHSVSPIWIEFSDLLKSSSLFIAKFYPDDGTLEKKQGRRSQRIESPTKAPSKFDNLLVKIDKLFAEKVEFYGPVDINQGAILTGIIKLVLKCFVEQVRMLNLMQRGFHQLQLDIEALRKAVWVYSNDDVLIDSLFNEVLNSAFRRTVEPQMVPRSNLLEILGENE